MKTLKGLLIVLFLIIIGTINPIWGQDPTLVLHLSAAQGFTDLAGNNTVQNIGGVSIVNTPWGGKAFQFSGSNYLEIPDADNSLDFVGDFTIEFLFAPIGQSGVMLSKEALSDLPRNLTLSFGPLGNNYSTWFGAGGGVASGTWVVPGEWRKLVFISQGGSFMYIVGDQQHGWYEAYNWQQSLTKELNNEPLRIGEGFLGLGSQNGAVFYKGFIDGIRIYKRALDLSEIQGFEYSGYTVSGPMPPKNLFATAGNNQVSLKWTQNPESDFVYYKIFSSTDGNSFVQIAEVTNRVPTYKLTGLENGLTYYCKITAIDKLGRESDFSNQVVATPNESESGLVLHLNAENPFVDLARGATITTNGSVTIEDTWGSKAYRFDGSGFLEIPDVDNSLDFIGDFTIEVIHNPEVGNGIICSKGGYESNPRNLSLGFGTWPNFQNYWWGVEGNSSGGPQMLLNQWKKVVFICKDDAWFLKEGNQESGWNVFIGMQQKFADQQSDGPVRVGRGWATIPDLLGDVYFTGQIADIKVYNRALDPSEITTLPIPVNLGPEKTVYYGYDPMACVTLSPSIGGGIPPFTYSWSTGETAPAITVCPEVGPDLANFKEYAVTITDSKGDTGFGKVVVNIVDVRCGNKNDKVLVCKKENTKNPVILCVTPGAVPAQLKNGATLGSCGLKQGFEDRMEPILEPQMTIYPNPNDGNVNVYLKDMGNDNLTIIIRDVLGRVVYEEVEPSLMGQYLKKIFLSQSGIYSIAVKTENSLFLEQFVVIK